MKVNQHLLRHAFPGRYLLSAAVVFGLAGGALAVWQAHLLSRVVTGVFLKGEALAQVSSILGYLFAVMVGRAGLTWGMEFAASAAAIRIKKRLRQELFEHLLALGPAVLRGERTGELTHVVVEGIEALQAYFSQYLPQLVLAALVPLALLFFILPQDALSAVVLLLTAPLMPVFMALIGSLAEAVTRRQWKALSRMSAFFLDILQGLATLKVFGRAGEQVRRIARLSEQHRRTTMQVLRLTFLSALALELLSTLSTAIVAVEVGLRLLYGRLSFEQAFFVLLLAPEFYLPLRLLGSRFHAGMAGLAAAERIDEILGMPLPLAPLPNQGEGGLTLPPSPLPIQGEGSGLNEFRLAFEGVTYAYPGSPPVLKDISFNLRAGERVAVVGHSGAGKSTLASLVLRFTEPAQGRITLDGQDISSLPVGAWRQWIAWVPQRPHLFHDRVIANLRMARPEASMEEIIRAARLAHAHEFIEELPNGYSTSVGERGARLSGGQAQRIALARAFLKDAPILILDEPTSSLDPEQEALINDSLEKLVVGRLTLVIAHRLATAARADRILVLDGGRLVESGTHADLMQRDGQYRKLVLGEAPLSLDDLSAMDRRSPSPPPSFSRAQTDGSIDFSPLLRSPFMDGLEPGKAMELPHPAQFQRFLTLWRLLRLVAPYSGWIALSVLLGAATIGSSIGLMSASAYIISAAALQPSIAALQLAIVGVRFFGLSRGVFRYLERLVSHQVTLRVLARLRVWFYQALEPLAPARLLSYHSGDLLSRAIGELAVLENFYLRGLAPPLVALVVGSATLVYVQSFAPSLAAILLVFLLMGGIALPIWMYWLERGVGERVVRSQAALNAFLVDSLQGIGDILAFSRAGDRSREMASLGEGFGTAQQRMAGLSALQIALGGLVAHLGMWAVLLQAIILVTAGRLNGVYLAVVALAALTSFEAVLPLPQAAQVLESQLAAARRLFEWVDVEPEVRDPDRPAPPPRDCTLEVRGLSFRYPESVDGQTGGQPAPWVLENLDFSLSQGGKIAVVGPSGAGKSTLAYLLLRFWEYSQGRILLGGKELHCYRQEDVRRMLSLVSQTTDLFNATIKDNLLLARPDAAQEDLFRAARLAQMHDFILSLPQGYDTRIGEQGLRMSGGERQRLAVARALLKDAPLLILDEPTANLDPSTERRLMDCLKVLMQDRTTLLITHRLVGLETMDEILVLDKGRVVERGCHADLLEAGGLYRRLWELQNQAVADAWDV